MMHSEFCKMAGMEISYKAYTEKFEPMYMATNMSKQEFIDFMMPTIKAVAKQEKKEHEAEELKNQKLVYVSDGTRTPNRGYYYGKFMKLVGCDIKTGKALVRELTDEEYKEEVLPHYSSNCNGEYDFLECECKAVA